MQVSDILRPEGICLQADVTDETQAIHIMVGMLRRCGVLSDADAFEKDVLAREADGTTAMGGGLAIPHAKSAAVKAPGLVAMTLRNPIDYNAADGAPVRLMFMIAAPEQAEEVHMHILSGLAMLLMDGIFCERLYNAKTPGEFLHIINLQEAANRREEAAKAGAAAPVRYRLLAVTACPAGIAHTYMAAEALTDKAAELGISLKVETNGAAGPENVLTAEEIAAAECIVVAADRTVAMQRFDGKPLLRVTVTEALRNPETVLNKAVAGDAPVYRPQDDDEMQPERADKQQTEGKTDGANVKSAEPATTTENGLQLVQKMYGHLMNGIAHMLPFVTGAGLLIACSYLFDGTNLGNADFGTGTTLSWLIRTMGELTMNMVFPVLAGYIAVSIAGKPALLPGMMGGYLAELGMTVQERSAWVPAGFWGALIAGFAAGAIVYGVKRMLRHFPNNLRQIKMTLLYPGISLALIGALMIFVVNPPVGYFNIWLYSRLGDLGKGSGILLGAVIGAMMASDFGGPINKAAYLFAAATLTTGNLYIISAAMLGGMVPSIGVALSGTLFRILFTRAERQTAISNYVLGASFVTEGALPFALKDPLRIIPSCMIGSAVAGGLSVALGCRVPAPHGGLFLLPLIGNRSGFLFALCVGSLITALIIGILRMGWPSAELKAELAEDARVAEEEKQAKQEKEKIHS